jgi:hypothetical protein
MRATHHATTQKHNDIFCRENLCQQKEARRCDLPTCQASAADLKDNEVFKKCGHCRVAIYCCKAHAIDHLPEHEKLCEELTRTCDYPGCEYIAANNTRCRQCKVAMYCSKRHRERHKSAHEGRCKELCLYRDKKS